MKRKDIMENCPEEFEDELKTILDHLEGQFEAVRDLLDITSISQISDIEDAYDAANSAASDLY